jgi:type I restriction enzyme R subunit
LNTGTFSYKIVNNRKSPEQIDATIRQLVSKAITTGGQVIDVFTAAGLPKPDISILSDQFLAEVRGLKHKNVAAELLEKLLKDELKVRSKRNLVQSQLFSENSRRPSTPTTTAPSQRCRSSKS